MYNVHDFIAWALTHAKPSSIPEYALLPIPRRSCGAEPWNYLFGSVRVRTDRDTLNRYFENHYKNQMTRERFDALTSDWPESGFATDCQGLLDAWLTYECGEPTDINADMNYRLLCTDKGLISEITRPWVIGEAVFRANSAGKMKHIGWVCGMDGSEPLIVEAKGIAYGVIVTRLYDGKWTHRGLMSKKFDYTEDTMIKFEVTSPMQTGMAYSKMQDALNAAGYTDADGNALESDGKWGRKSQQAFDKFIASYARKPEPLEVFNGEGKYRLVLEYK